MDVPCVNCKKEFPSDEGKFWERIFLCPDCYQVATRIVERGEARLKWILSTLRQAVKQAAMEGRLQFATEEEANRDEAGPAFIHQLNQLVNQTRHGG